MLREIRIADSVWNSLGFDEVLKDMAPEDAAIVRRFEHHKGKSNVLKSPTEDDIAFVAQQLDYLIDTLNNGDGNPQVKFRAKKLLELLCKG